MPYIKQEDREKVLQSQTATTPGELNYLFTEIIETYIRGQLNYQRINDVVGALEGAKLEFYRRVAAPYENVKIEENGDVY
jgi:hypothetical protein